MLDFNREELEELQAKFPTKNVKFEYEMAQDFVLATGRKYKNYLAFFRNWLRRAKDTRVPPKMGTLEKLREMEVSPEQREKNLNKLAELRKQVYK